jgi:hypothetical protein
MKTLKATLEFFSEKELEVLHKIVKSKENTIDSILDKLGKTLKFQFFGSAFSTDSYKEILLKIAKHNNISLNVTHTEVVIEKELFLKLYQKNWAGMNNEEKEEFLLNLKKQGLSPEQLSSISGLATIGAAQASGMGIYLLASSTFGALSSLVGITLPFAFYTTVSSIISFAIGPIGILVLGIGAYRSFQKIKSFDDFLDITANSYQQIKRVFVGDYERATAAIHVIASNRILIEQNLEHEITAENEILEEKKEQGNNYYTTIDQNKRYELELDKSINQAKIILKELNEKVQAANVELTTLDKKKDQLFMLNTQINNQLDVLNKEQNESISKISKLKEKYSTLKKIELN